MKCLLIFITLLAFISCNSPEHQQNNIKPAKKSLKKFQIVFPGFVSQSYDSTSRIYLVSIKEYGKDTNSILDKYNKVYKSSGDYYKDDYLHFIISDTFQIKNTYEITLMINKKLITNKYSDFKYLKSRVFGGFINNLISYKKNGIEYKIDPSEEEIFDW
jgi:hypothetical protein